MESLLADVVDYWATGTGDRQVSRTDMEAVLGQALLLTDKQIAERAAILPMTSADGHGKLRNTGQGPASSDSKRRRILRHAFSARSRFSQTRGFRMGVPCETTALV